MDPNIRNIFFSQHVVPGEWEIIVAASSKANHNSIDTQFRTAGVEFRTSTAANTGANNRTAFGDGSGVYNGYFTKQNITKVAFVDGSGNLSDPTSHTKYIVYELVESTGAQSIYELLLSLDSYNLNNPSWHGNDTVFGADSATNFVAGSAKSGSVILDSGDYTDEDGDQPDKFCIWGVNRDGDNDTQVLCAFSGDLTTGKGDAWRNSNPKETFWSFWGNDWHSNTQNQTISKATQTPPGYQPSLGSGLGLVYLIAF